MCHEEKDVLRQIQEHFCLRACEFVVTSDPRSAPQRAKNHFLEESLDKVTFVT